LTNADKPAPLPDQFQALLHWQDQQPLFAGRIYSLRMADYTANVTITRIKYLIDPATGEHLAATALQQGETGVCNLALEPPLPGAAQASTAFDLLDLTSLRQVGNGELQHGLRRASNLVWQSLEINKQARAAAMQQRPCVLWLTGLSGSGKSTIANQAEKLLFAAGRHTYLLDGDNVRHGLNRDLGFTAADRVENIRRVAETAKLMVDAGLIVITSFISPFRAEREMARALFETGEFVEVFIDTPLAECEKRDPKGLYHKARQGGIKNFTGYDSPYEAPGQPELHIETLKMSAEQAALKIVKYLQDQ
jgi:bifunctional enzyme CysN/CysC